MNRFGNDQQAVCLLGDDTHTHTRRGGVILTHLRGLVVWPNPPGWAQASAGQTRVQHPGQEADSTGQRSPTDYARRQAAQRRRIKRKKGRVGARLKVGLTFTLRQMNIQVAACPCNTSRDKAPVFKTTSSSESTSKQHVNPAPARSSVHRSSPM